MQTDPPSPAGHTTPTTGSGTRISTKLLLSFATVLAISQVERVTQANASSAEENATAGTDLNEQSTMLRNVVDRLTQLV